MVVDSYLIKEPGGDLLSGHNRALNFATCLFREKSGNQFDNLQRCSNQKLKPDVYAHLLKEISHNSDYTKEVMQKMESKTKQALEDVGAEKGQFPLVTINGKVSYNGFDDLVQEVCTQYTVSSQLTANDHISII